ncbi:MAG: hypothetical protein AAF974_07210 [Cyanobacteria bacterium P01_E01_bin.34]
MIACTVLAIGFTGISLSPARAQRRGRVDVRGPRGGEVEGARGPHGAGYIDAEGPRGGDVEGARGPFGAGYIDAEGAGGREVEGTVGPRGRGTVTVEGPRGEASTYGRVRYPNLDPIRRPYVRYPGYRTYGNYYGLYPPLAAYPGLAFLTAGLLIASFESNDTTVYVYHIEQECEVIEYQVDDGGNIVSETVVGPAENC